MSSNTVLIHKEPVAIVGGGPVSAKSLKLARERCPIVVAADSGADRLVRLETKPDAIIGDMDSITGADIWAKELGHRFIRLDEQDTTDFEKCLYSIEAPFFLCLGFMGGRLDHTISALNTVLRYPEKKLLFLDDHDVVKVLANEASIHLRMPVGSRVSIMPLKQIRCLSSRGLRWPVDNKRLSVGGHLSVSNEIEREGAAVFFDGTGAVIATDPENMSAFIG